ncbi:MAG: hypothetical protein PHS41_11580 [Victivallaceae bacterium]|nr:hypothetical protein [Victivallaceae bacterium]
MKKILGKLFRLLAGKNSKASLVLGVLELAAGGLLLWNPVLAGKLLGYGVLTMLLLGGSALILGGSEAATRWRRRIRLGMGGLLLIVGGMLYFLWFRELPVWAVGSFALAAGAGNCAGAWVDRGRNFFLRVLLFGGGVMSLLLGGAFLFRVRTSPAEGFLGVYLLSLGVLTLSTATWGCAKK